MQCSKFVQVIIKEASYDTDKKQSDTAKNIIEEIKIRIKTGKKITYTNDYVFTKLGDLEIYLYDQRSETGKYYNSQSIFAQFIPDKFDPKIYSFNNLFNKRNNKLVYNLGDEYLYHEIIHYLDFKRGSKDSMIKAASNQVKKDSTAEDYYNSPAEFNAYFMQYVFPNITKYISEKDTLTNFNQFKDAIVNYNKKSQYFFSNLNDKMKKRAMKRLYVVYDNIKKNEDAARDRGESAENSTKKNKLSILNKLKHFFMNNQ